MRALEVEGLVEIRDQKAKLTRRGKWYARTAAYREAERLACKEEAEMEELMREERLR